MKRGFIWRLMTWRALSISPYVEVPVGVVVVVGAQEIRLETDGGAGDGAALGAFAAAAAGGRVAVDIIATAAAV